MPVARTFATEASTQRTPQSPPPYKPKHADPTPSEASNYLSSLVSLPFPPELALQILTHKSYRFVHRISHPPPYTASEIAQSQASHNARLAFMGRRALAAYTAMFIHSSVGSSSTSLSSIDFLRGKTLDEKLEALRHSLNLGRQVGEAWKISDYMRWDRNEVGDASRHAKVQGQAVEAVIGGVFTQFGSAEAQKTFFRHVLPLLAPQLRDPMLIEAAEREKTRAKA